VRFIGKELPHAARPHQIEVVLGQRTPEGHDVTGVITARCETYNGASGLFEASCNEESMLTAAKRRAAEAGGTALMDPRCENRLLEQSVERLEQGGAKSHRRVELKCHATVLRRQPGAPPLRPIADRSSTGERTRIEHVWVTIHAKAEGSITRPVVEVDAVAEAERIAAGQTRVGVVSAVCEADCSSSISRRGLKHAAAKLGATAIVEVRCEPVGDRWACQGVAIAASVDPPPNAASATP
jgi:hypothetical protein